MKKIYYCILLAVLAMPSIVKADNGEGEPKAKKEQVLSARDKTIAKATAKSIKDDEFKPSISLGAIVHMYAGSEQKGFVFGGNPGADNAKDWNSDFTVYRSRILIGGKLSEKGSFFMETELMQLINGSQNGDDKSIRVMPMVLDCQYEHNFSKAFSVIAGLQLVSHNRNGLQGAAGLMANDFTYFQYPNNMHPNSPLQNNLGRDLGVNFRGIVASEKLEYRVGVFSGRTAFEGMTKDAPVRVVGRLAYNVFDKDESFYYSGTNLGEGKTLSIGAGIDTQGTYMAVGGDVFLDMPITDAGSITLNGAYSYITGGNDPAASFTFNNLIPTQSTQYMELGYYHKKSKIQPWIRYEKQALASEDMQTGGMPVEDFDKGSVTVFGGGVNYWYAKNNTNLRLSYTSSKTETSDSYGQVWLQLQFFIF